jgi:DNA replication protein DnaC
VLKEHADAEVEALGLETERAAAEADDDLAALPDSVRTFSRERLQALTRLADWQPGSAAPKGWSVFYGVGEPPKPIPMYTAAAIIRGELPYEPQPAGTDGTRTNDEGLWIADFRHHALAMEVEVMLDQFDPDPIVLSRDNYDPDYVSAVVEPEFNKPELSLASIKPYPPSPVPLQKQAELIEVVRNLPRLRTWFLTGPPPGGSSKTALAYAYIKDLITQRLAEAQKTFGYGSEFNLCVYRIHAGKWMHEMAAWMTHDFHDYDAHPPQVNPEAIDEAYQSMAKKMGWKIVLLIDDLCKFDPNGKRNGWLHGIVDAITEKDGLIITTTNKTIAELARMGFDTATLSRLDGSRFLAEDRLVMDFHRYARR